MKRNDLFVKMISSALGLGHLPIAPGSWASAGATGLYIVSRWLAPSYWPLFIAPLLLTVFVVGVPLSPRAEKVYGKKDPRPFVLDEVAGMWLTCLMFWWHTPILTGAVAFLAFRVFDVFKPPPIRWLERLPRGWGVMVDDLGAAVYSVLLLWPLCYYVIDPLLQW